MNRNLSLLVLFCLPLAVTVACKRENLQKACPHDAGLRTYAQWQSQVALPYKAPEEKLRQIKDNYDHVAVGSSKSEVIQAFGPPDFEQEAYPKVQNQPCFYEFDYFFEKPAELANEVKDKRVTVFFTQNGKVRWIVGNVGLSEKGGPTPTERN